MPRDLSFLFALLIPIAVLLAPPAAAGSGVWEDILHLQDGRYNNAARLDYDWYRNELRMAWKWQVGTDSNTRQIAAGNWSDWPLPLWTFDDLTGNVSSKEYPDVAVTLDGVAHVVWREHLGGGDWQAFYAGDRGGAWSPPIQLTFDATVKGSPVIAAADTSGFVHIAYSTLETGSTNDEIWYLLYDTVADTTASLQITSDAVTDDDVTIDVTEDGAVSLAWITGALTGALRCFEGNIDGFTEIPTGVTSGAAKPDLELDHWGNQHIAYRHTITSSFRVIRYVRRQGAGFGAPTDVSPSDALYTEPSILVAAGGWPAIAYVTNTAGKKGLYVSKWEVNQFVPPDTVHADESVTYNETDFEVNPVSTGLPLRGLSQAFVVTSTGYVAADTVRADLHVFTGSVFATGAPGPVVAAPSALSLAARPNPFRSATTIVYALPEAATVRLDVHDVTGRRVERLAEGSQPAGPHDFTWSPDRLPAGVYWVRLTAGGCTDAVSVRRVR